MVRGDLAAFSGATIERGRLRGLSDACDAGRLCQDKVEFLEGMAFEGEALADESPLLSSSLLLCSLSTGDIFSFIGDVGPLLNFSIASSFPNARASEPLPGSIFGD